MEDAERVTGITQDEGKTREEMKVGGAREEPGSVPNRAGVEGPQWS